MEVSTLKKWVQEIVLDAAALKDKHTSKKDAPVNYACIFSQSEEEFEELLAATQKMGKIIRETPTGPLFHIEPLKTASGILQLLKIRRPDPTRTQRGDADFTITEFQAFEREYLGKQGFRKMQKPDFYMIELVDKDFDVRTYFSNPPLDKQLKLK